MAERIRIVAIDDSSVAREKYRKILAAAAGMDLVSAVPSALLGRTRIRKHDPDVVILDVNMPGTNGLTFLKWLMRNHPTPVVISSTMDLEGANNAMDAFALGAVDVICKGGDDHAEWAEGFQNRLLDAVRGAAKAGKRIRAKRGAAPALVAPAAAEPLERPLAPRAGSGAKPPAPVAVLGRLRPGSLVAIAASAGGTEALAQLVAQMPPGFPPTVLVQHMPPIFTRSFAERLDRLGQVEVLEATGPVPLQPGRVVVAPGDRHLRVYVGKQGPAANVSEGPPVSGHVPSGDVLFESVAAAWGSRAIGVILTGMGSDGARGLLRMRQAGAFTIAQDEATSLVFGMPQAAVDLGAASVVLPLGDIVPRIVAKLSESARTAARG